MNVSPQKLAEALKARGLVKDAQTIRRWCDRGHIPGAYRKCGKGHWRIRGKLTERLVNTVLENVEGFARRPKVRKNPHERYAELMNEALNPIRERERNHRFFLSVNKVLPEEDLSQQIKKWHGLTEEDFKITLEAFLYNRSCKPDFNKHYVHRDRHAARVRRRIENMGGSQVLAIEEAHGITRKCAYPNLAAKSKNEHRIKAWDEAAKSEKPLSMAARFLLMRSPSSKGFSAWALAKELGISRATLYRRFSATDIRSALPREGVQSTRRRTSSE